jgi:hypothetical protein
MRPLIPVAAPFRCAPRRLTHDATTSINQLSPAYRETGKKYLKTKSELTPAIISAKARASINRSLNTRRKEIKTTVPT